MALSVKPKLVALVALVHVAPVPSLDTHTSCTALLSLPTVPPAMTMVVCPAPGSAA